MSQYIRVWDLPTRLFHWSLVGLVAAMWASGEQGGEWLQYHVWCGIALAVLLLFRVLWGMAGSQTARFASFVRGPVGVLAYIKGQVTEQDNPGHNPLGGWMVVLMLLALLVQVGTGLFASDVDSYLFNGPLAGKIASDLSESLTSFHKNFFNLILALVALHVSAIIAYRVFKKQNLVRPMITGYKQMDGQPSPLMFKPLIMAVVTLLLSGLAVYLLLTYF